MRPRWEDVNAWRAGAGRPIARARGDRGPLPGPRDGRAGPRAGGARSHSGGEGRGGRDGAGILAAGVVPCAGSRCSAGGWDPGTPRSPSLSTPRTVAVCARSFEERRRAHRPTPGSPVWSPRRHCPSGCSGSWAERGSIREQGVLLLGAGHPCGHAVLAAASDREPDLFRIELAIARTLAERAVRGSRGTGRFLRDYVAAMIDRDNCRTALVLAAIGTGEPTASLFLPGGGLRPEEFERAPATRDPVMAARALGAVPATRDLAPILLQHATSPADLERALEDRAVTTVQRDARLNPLGPAPVLFFLHRIRQQSIALARLVWSAGSPVHPAALAGAEVA